MSKCNQYFLHSKKLDDKINNKLLDRNINYSDNIDYLENISNNNIRGVNNKTNYGSYIDKESSLRYGKLTNIKNKDNKILKPRPFATTPYSGHGSHKIKDPVIYSKLMDGIDTHAKKSTNSLSGVSMDRFIPLVPCIKDNIQDPKHIVPEYWVNGGESTRAIIQNVDYFKMCGIKK